MDPLNPAYIQIPPGRLNVLRVCSCSWPQDFHALLLSAAEGADLMDPAAWTLTAALPFDGAWLAGGPANGTGGGASPGAAAAPAPGGRLPGGKEAEGDAHGGAGGSPGPAPAPGPSPAADAADGPGGYLEGATYTVNEAISVSLHMAISAVPVDCCCHCIYHQHR